jgi:hypothetical protein
MDRFLKRLDVTEKPEGLKTYVGSFSNGASDRKRHDRRSIGLQGRLRPKHVPFPAVLSLSLLSFLL